MNHLTPNEQAMRARCDAATKGPWQQDGDQTIDGDAEGFRFEIARPSQVPPHYGGIITAGLRTLHNAAFIAHARQDLPACLDTIEKLRGELAEAQALLERYLDTFANVELDVVDADALAFLAKHKEPNDGNK